MARFDTSGHLADASGPAGGGADALLELGLRYCAGRDCPVDLVLAHKWFNLAAISGNQEAKHYRMEVARDLCKADIAKAQRLAREWLSRKH